MKNRKPISYELESFRLRKAKGKTLASGLEVLLGTTAYRASIFGDLEERTQSMSGVIGATATMLDYLADRIDRGERESLDAGDFWALSKILKAQAKEIASLHQSYLKLATPADVILPRADVDFEPSRKALVARAKARQ